MPHKICYKQTERQTDGQKETNRVKQYSPSEWGYKYKRFE